VKTRRKIRNYYSIVVLSYCPMSCSIEEFDITAYNQFNCQNCFSSQVDYGRSRSKTRQVTNQTLSMFILFFFIFYIIWLRNVHFIYHFIFFYLSIRNRVFKHIFLVLIRSSSYCSISWVTVHNIFFLVHNIDTNWLLLRVIINIIRNLNVHNHLKTPTTATYLYLMWIIIKWIQKFKTVK